MRSFSVILSACTSSPTNTSSIELSGPNFSTPMLAPEAVGVLESGVPPFFLLAAEIRVRIGFYFR